MEIDKHLKLIFKNTFELDLVDEELEMNDIALWDSTGHINLIISLEKEFSITIMPEEILELTSYRKIKNFIGGKI